MPKKRLYLAYEFRNRQKAKRHLFCDNAAQAAERARGALLLLGCCTEVIETQLVVCRSGERHTYTALERQNPDFLYFCVIKGSVLKQLQREAGAEWRKKMVAIRREIEFNAHIHTNPVAWDDLPQNWKNRIKINSRGCWIWRTRDKQAPYDRVYFKMRGPIPKGAFHCHDCDNRYCVNPNHIRPGTPKDNAQDMVGRGRHGKQKGRRRIQKNLREAGPI